MEKIEYDRLLEIAKSMHTWIFLNTGDEQEAYDQIGLSDDENEVLGYGGQIAVPVYLPPELPSYNGIKIKPCPLCGGKPYLERNSRGFFGGVSCHVSYVRCTRCEAKGAKFPLDNAADIDASQQRQKAVEAWNRRCDE